MEHLADIIQNILRRQEQKGGVKVSGLEIGTRLLVETHNSIYEIKYIGNNREVEVSGGMFGNEVVTGHFIGSTWGTALLKMDWIGEGMRMEMALDGRLIDTSPVKAVEIHAPDGSWSYSMDWYRDDHT